MGHGACNPRPEGVGVGVSECGCLVMHACMSVRGIHVCGLGMGACAWVYMGACVCVLARGCLRVHVCVVCECVCMHGSTRVRVCMHACECIWVRACVHARVHEGMPASIMCACMCGVTIYLPG